LLVADGFAGRLDESPYFGNYERWTLPWKLAVGEVDGEPAVVIMRLEGASWRPYSVVRLDFVGENNVHIRDYAHYPWMIPAAGSLIVADPFNLSRDVSSATQ